MHAVTHVRAMDRSIRRLLEHRVGTRRADQLTADYADGLFDADKEIAIALGAPACHDDGATLTLKAPVSHGCTWSGTTLRLAQAIPDTVVAALAGRTLGEIVRHPALPEDRVIEAAASLPDGDTVIRCRSDIVPAADLVVRREPAPAIWARRRQEEETLRYGMRSGACRHVAGFPVPGLVCMALAPLLTLAIHFLLDGAWTATAAMGTLGLAFAVMGATDGHDRDMGEGDGYHWMRDRLASAHRRMLEDLATAADAQSSPARL